MSAKKTETKDKLPIKWRYVGGGAFIPSIPARDLTPEEMAGFADAISAESKQMGVTLYEAVYEAEQPEVPAEEQS